jgi:hypothetical protein
MSKIPALLARNVRIWHLCRAAKVAAAYVDKAVEEEEDAGGIAVLSGGGEQEDVVVLDEGVGDAGAVVDDGRVDLRVALITGSKKCKARIKFAAAQIYEGRGSFTSLSSSLVKKRSAWSAVTSPR